MINRIKSVVVAFR